MASSLRMYSERPYYYQINYFKVMSNIRSFIMAVLTQNFDSNHGSASDQI